MTGNRIIILTEQKLFNLILILTGDREMTKLEKANRSFNYACKQASKCRHEKYQVSCFGCPEIGTCEIQERVNKNLKIKRELS